MQVYTGPKLSASSLSTLKILLRVTPSIETFFHFFSFFLPMKLIFIFPHFQHRLHLYHSAIITFNATTMSPPTMLLPISHNQLMPYVIHYSLSFLHFSFSSYPSQPLHVTLLHPSMSKVKVKFFSNLHSDDLLI